MLVVFVVGSVDPKLLGMAKRVKEYRPDDYEVLFTFLSLYSDVIILPNTVTEVSNLLRYLKGDQRQDCLERLAQLTKVSMERYIISSVAAEQLSS